MNVAFLLARAALSKSESRKDFARRRHGAKADERTGILQFVGSQS
jgi:hypothetical protein